MASYDPDFIRVAGAREHNLRDVSLTLRKNRLICFTGVSGSGKSSLAFDTLYAEGQRRYIESLSSYARQFIGQLPKPNVDQISGLAPSVSIQQKTSGWNPRSTVGTITQIHDYLRVLFARAGVQHCPKCGAPISAQSREQMVQRILSLPGGTRFLLLSPKVREQKGTQLDLFGELLRQGFARARVDGQIIELASPPPLDKNRRHNVEVVVDRLTAGSTGAARLTDALETALQAGDGAALVALLPEGPAAGLSEEQREFRLSAAYACAKCQIGFEPPTPQMFSFNSPQGMCSKCDGLGTYVDFDEKLLVPDSSLSFLAPCVAPLRRPPGRWRRHFYEGVARHVGFELKTPWRDLPSEARKALLYGTGDTHITFEWRTRGGTWRHGGKFEGVVAELQAAYKKSSSTMVRGYYESFMRSTLCDACQGARLNAQALGVRLAGRAPGWDEPRSLNIDEVSKLPVSDALAFFGDLQLNDVQTVIAVEPLKEITARLRFLVDVGLEYLSLDRRAPTLSGGESQRIRLASQIGSGLTGVLYVLDEPSIGLHPRDNRRLLQSLQRLRDMGNTVIVVEHDRETMEAADEIIDFGPGPGVRGGQVVAQGDLRTVGAASESLTGAYLSGRMEIPIPASRRPVMPLPRHDTASPDKPPARARTRLPKQ